MWRSEAAPYHGMCSIRYEGESVNIGGSKERGRTHARVTLNGERWCVTLNGRAWKGGRSDGFRRDDRDTGG